MISVKVWDPLVRMAHWAVALLFVANMTVLDEDSVAHAYAGYALFGIVLVRLIWGIIGTKHARFRSFWPTREAVKRHLRGYIFNEHDVHVSHNPLGALMVFNLLGTLVAIGMTGVMIGSLGFANSGWLTGLHEVLANYATLCVGLHILGVLFETRRSGVDLIKGMISGRKTLPDTTSTR